MELPMIHPRHQKTAKARFEITEAINRTIAKYGLTDAEVIFILAGELSAWSSDAIKAEREQEQS